MHFQRSELSHRQKGFIAEVIYLLVIGILSPLAVGMQIFSEFSLTLSLVLFNILQLPVIILFYRVFLPYTVGKRRYLLALVTMPLYILIYEVGSRLCSIAMIQLTFIPKAYREQLLRAHPEDFSSGYFNQSLGYTCLVLLAASSLYVVKLLFREKHNFSTLETEKLKLELNQLKAQLQPHFFFNTLNNIYSLSVQQSKDAPKMIDRLSAIMRYVLYECGQEKVDLEREVSFIRSYIELENLRYQGNSFVDFEIQGDMAGVAIEPLLFMPLVENAFKHGLNTLSPDSNVKLVLSLDDSEIIFQTMNARSSGNGRSADGFGGIGLTNLKKRLELGYPGRHELIIHEETFIFTVTLVIDIT